MDPTLIHIHAWILPEKAWSTIFFWLLLFWGLCWVCSSMLSSSEGLKRARMSLTNFFISLWEMTPSLFSSNLGKRTSWDETRVKFRETSFPILKTWLRALYELIGYHFADCYCLQLVQIEVAWFCFIYVARWKLQKMWHFWQEIGHIWKKESE